MKNDTIAAVATARGEAGVAVVRVSGPEALSLLTRAFSKKAAGFAPGRLYYGHVAGGSGEALDEAMAVYMKAPKSYTREDVAEIQCHGGDVAAGRTLSRLLALGARPALPGEFTRRAFENGRIDLAQAEAVLSMVTARSEGAARAAMRALNGGPSRKILDLAESLTALLSRIEAADDFPEEIEEETARADVLAGALEIQKALTEAANDKNARYLCEGMHAALVGKPNAGKSSLMNALLGEDRAIVTQTPGTTRDVLTGELSLSGIRVTLWDTAGVRETDDPIEKLGVSRAEKARREADVVLLVLDGASPLEKEDRDLLAGADARYVLVIAKSDLPQVLSDAELPAIETLRVSSVTGAGMDALRKWLQARAALPENAFSGLVVERHRALAKAAAACCARAAESVEGGLPLDAAAIDLEEALERLREITGQSASDATIDAIFQNFCVGK